jgi:uncharacterized protein (DUF486 family)
MYGQLQEIPILPLKKHPLLSTMIETLTMMILIIFNAIIHLEQQISWQRLWTNNLSSMVPLFSLLLQLFFLG